MSKFGPDEIAELFIATIMLLIFVPVLSEIYLDTSLIDPITKLIEFLVYAFIFVLLVAVFKEGIEDIMN